MIGIKEKDFSCMRSLAIYYKKIEKDYELTKKYFLMAVEKNDFFAMNDLAVYYETIEKNDDLAKKYFLMALEGNHPIIIGNIVKYYGRNNEDLSFVDLYKYEKEFMNLFDKRFENYVNLDKKYYHSFLQWDTKNNIIKMKQYILKKTGVFPKKYTEVYLIHFMEIISLKNTRLPKDMLNLIAGHLFV